MSYKSRKRKKSKLNKLKFSIGLILIRLFYNIKMVVKKRKEKKMQFPGTRKVMVFLRERNKIIRKNNLKVNEWVDSYLNQCLLDGRAVNILTFWCISKSFERRFEEQGSTFIPTRKERRILDIEIPRVLDVFLRNGFRVNWWITFNRSYLDSRQIPREMEDKYKEMILGLVQNPLVEENVSFFDWEYDILGARSAPDKRILEDFKGYIKQDQFKIELQRWQKWRAEQTDLKQTDEELKTDVKYQIACEANEGRFLIGDSSLFGSEGFILIPLEMPERFDNFTIFAPDFKKRIVSVLSLYPWRLR